MTFTKHSAAGTGLAICGLLMILTASALPLLNPSNSWFGWLYGAGAVMLLAGRLLSPHPKDCPLRLRRLLRMEVWTSLVFLVGAVFAIFPLSRGNDWLAFTMAGGVLTAYTSVMIPRQKTVSADNEGKRKHKK